MRRLLHSSALCCSLLLAVSAQAQSSYYKYPAPDSHHVSSHNKQVIKKSTTKKPRPTAVIDQSFRAPRPGDQPRNVFLPQHQTMQPTVPIAMEAPDSSDETRTNVEENTPPLKNTPPPSSRDTASVHHTPTPILKDLPVIEKNAPDTIVVAPVVESPVQEASSPPQTIQLIDNAGIADDDLMAMIPEADDIFEIAPAESAAPAKITHSPTPEIALSSQPVKIDTQPSQKADTYHTLETTGISPSLPSPSNETPSSSQTEQIAALNEEEITELQRNDTNNEAVETLSKPIKADDSIISPSETTTDITLTAGNTLVPPPSLSELPEIVAPTHVSPPGISEDTYRILSMIPSNIDRPSSFSKRRVSIKRENPEAGLSSIDEDIARHEGLGLSIAVKRRRYDGAYDLQRAYDALVAGQTQEAISIYQEVIDNLPHNTDALFGLATTYQRIGHLDESRYYYAKLFAIDAGHREGINNFLALVSEESPDEALLYLEELEQRNPDFSAVPAQIALIRSHIGDIEGAKIAMIRAMRLAPNNLVYRYNLAIMLDNAGNIPEARALYIQLIEAAQKGQKIPASIQDLQKRLTFISSNG